MQESLRLAFSSLSRVRTSDRLHFPMQVRYNAFLIGSGRDIGGNKMGRVVAKVCFLTGSPNSLSMMVCGILSDTLLAAQQHSSPTSGPSHTTDGSYFRGY